LRNFFIPEDPTGTPGPQLAPRPGGEHPPYPRPDLLPSEDDLPLLTARRAEEENPPLLPARSRPVVVAQIPPPPLRTQHRIPPQQLPLHQVIEFEFKKTF
jgi:hypothetical protein